jgi:hypothetical protein
MAETGSSNESRPYGFVGEGIVSSSGAVAQPRGSPGMRCGPDRTPRRCARVGAAQLCEAWRPNPGPAIGPAGALLFYRLSATPL